MISFRREEEEEDRELKRSMAEVVAVEVAEVAEVAEGEVDSSKLDLGYGSHEKNRIQVSNTKKPLFFYVNLAKVSRRVI